MVNVPASVREDNGQRPQRTRHPYPYFGTLTVTVVWHSVKETLGNGYRRPQITGEMEGRYANFSQEGMELVSSMSSSVRLTEGEWPLSLIIGGYMPLAWQTQGERVT